MKNISRILSILIMTMMIASPFMSFATEESSLDASGNGSEVSAPGDDAAENKTEEDVKTEKPSADSTEVSKEDAPSQEEAVKDDEENKENLPNEPTKVTVVDSVEALSEKSEAAYDNEAFFTIDASKDDSADLATDEVSEEVTDLLSGDGTVSEKQSGIVDTLEDSGLYRAEESGKSKVDVTSKFAYQRLKLVAPQKSELNAYGASGAVYFGDSYLLSYDSMEATMQAYEALVSEYGKDSVLIDMPMKLSSGEKGWGTAFMRMDYQKNQAGNSGKVTVAVVDSGIQRTHPVFSGKTILQGRDFVNNDNDPADDKGHGTEVSGVIAESTPANVRILPVKAMDANGEGSLIDIMNAVQYAENNGADIINLSIGGYLNDASDMQYCDELFSSYRALIVCASGNENRNLDEPGVMQFPGELSSTVCVGAITNAKERWYRSNYGQAIDFAAPGSSLMLAKLNGDYINDSGTSFASPYVASAAAIVKAGNSNYSKTQIANKLKAISVDIGSKGKDVYFGNGCPIFPYNSTYTLTAVGTRGTSPTTAEFTWRMDRPLDNGDKIDINGQKIVPRDNGNGTYSWTLVHFDPAKGYDIPIKVIDKNGKTVSNVIKHYLGPYYVVTAVGTRGTSPTTAEFTWKMSHPVTDGAKVDINGQKIVPRNNGNGTYSWTLVHFDPAKDYNIPVKVIDKNGRVLSNTTYHYLGPYYVVTALSTRGTSPTTAEFTWKMSHPVTDGAKVDINGQKIVPRNNGNGTYSWELVHFDPTKSYTIPVKVIDKNGKTLSNTTYHYLGTYYNLSDGKTTNISGDRATLNWKLNRALVEGHTFYVNDRKANPTRNSDGSYTCVVSGIRSGIIYDLPVKIVDAGGKTVSNVIKITVKG